MIPPLTLDYRQGSKEYEPHLRLLDIPVVVEHLEHGDAQVVGRGPDDRPVLVGVEFKKIDDLIRSLNDHRLTGFQLPGMMDFFEITYLLVEGLWTATERGELVVWNGKAKRYQPPAFGSRPWSYSALASRLMTLEDAKVRVAFTGDMRGTVAWLASLYNRWSRSWDSHRTLEGIHLKPLEADNPLTAGFFKPTRKMRALSGLADGIGFTKARAIADHFKSIKRAINASRKQWEEVPGVGKVLADRIVTEIERED